MKASPSLAQALAGLLARGVADDGGCLRSCGGTSGGRRAGRQGLDRRLGRRSAPSSQASRALAAHRLGPRPSPVGVAEHLDSSITG